MSLPRLSESIIRAGSTAESFGRGHACWRAGAVYNTTIQGNTLIGDCEGNSAPSYHVQIELDQAGILLAQCTCPYEYGGWCKHIVALLLRYVHEPEQFSVCQGPAELLAGLDREALVALVTTLLRERPELYDQVATAVAAPLAPGNAHRTRSQPVDVEVYRRQVRSLFRGLGRYNPYGYASTVVARLREVKAAAVRFLDAGEAEAALEILLALLEEAYDSFEYIDDSDGDLGGFFVDLGEPLAEAILSLELSPAERERIVDRLEEQARHLADYCSDEGLILALQAARYGWHTTPEEDDEYQAAESLTWRPFLVGARLNVLERQGCTEEYLAACQQAGQRLRYTLKLCDLGRVPEAAAYAGEHLAHAPDALVVAQRLRELGHAAEAISIAERGLRLSGSKASLAEWLAPIQEAQGRTEQALQAWLTVLGEQPSLDTYMNVKRLAGANWANLQPQALALVKEAQDLLTLAQVLLHEEAWDEAIRVAEEPSAWRLAVEAVAEGVVEHRPEWVVHISLRNAERLLVEAHSKNYPSAANWLRKAKRAYARLGREPEFRAYLEALKERYRRRPALQAELRQL